MALEPSILKSTKKILGLDAGYTAFDLDVMTHINTCFFTLNQLGVGPAEGFMVESDDEEWEDFLEVGPVLNAVKTYIYLRVRSIWDPPGTPHHISAMKDQITELEHRILTERELSQGPLRLDDPLSGNVVIDGGVG